MKSIFLLRHAKSDREGGSKPDVERPLSKRGRNASREVGGFLASQRLVFDRVYCSPSARTTETWNLVSRSARLTGIPVATVDTLYEASTLEVCRVIHEADPSADRILIVGHEPSMSGALAVLTGSHVEHFATGALARIDFPEADSWVDCADGAGHLSLFVSPRSLEPA